MNPEPARTEREVIDALGISRTVTEAVGRLGFTRSNLYLRAQRSTGIRDALEELQGRKVRDLPKCRGCPNTVGRPDHQFCSTACYWRWRRSNAVPR